MVIIYTVTPGFLGQLVRETFNPRPRGLSSDFGALSPLYTVQTFSSLAMEGGDGSHHYPSLCYHNHSTDNIDYIWPMQLFVRHWWKSRHRDSSLLF